FGSSIWAKFLLVFLILTLALWGIGDMLKHPAGSHYVARVGDTGVTGEEYERALRHESDKVRQMLGDNFSPELLKKFNIEPQVLHGLVDQTMLTLEAESLGLLPSDDEI